MQKFREKNHFALLQAPSVCETLDKNPNPNQIRRLGLPQMYKIFKQLNGEYNFEGIKRFRPTYMHYLRAFYSAKHRHYPKPPNFPKSEESNVLRYMEAAVEKELVSCEKSIFIGDAKDVRTELRYLKENYPQIRFYVGNNTGTGNEAKNYLVFFKP
jgi:hypothetical protein